MTKNHSRPAHKTKASPHPDTKHCPRSNTCGIQLQILWEFSLNSLYSSGILHEPSGNSVGILGGFSGSMLLDLISLTSGANAGISSNRCSCLSISRLLEQCQKVFRSMLMDNISSTSGAKARMSSNRCSWTSFRRLLEPRPECLQIDAPGYHFVDFWSQCQKVFKSILLDIISSTSGAKARMSLNRSSWTSFR